MINLEEILVANTAGIVILSVLNILRVENGDSRHTEGLLFDGMVALTFLALAAETASFLLDGVEGLLVCVLQYTINGYLFLASCGVGLIWVLYVDYMIYRSRKHLRKLLFLFAPPFLVIAGMIVCDLFGAGLIFSITPENVYLRGSYNIMPYLVMFFYYFSSFILAIRAVRKSEHPEFFPIYYFVLPCGVGIFVQGLRYGLATGWFSVSIALMSIRIQLQNRNTYVDELSGLFNRKYYLFYTNNLRKSQKKKLISGIMLDVNHFKSINDQFGHTVGDDAIRSVGWILSEVATEHSVAFHLSGDEFVIVSVGAGEQESQALMELIRQRVEQYNATAGKPFQLSLAMGCTVCEAAELDSDAFLHGMDMRMYEAKAAYYSQTGHSRRSTDRRE